jgi:hypothetical protein
MWSAGMVLNTPHALIKHSMLAFVALMLTAASVSEIKMMFA